MLSQATLSVHAAGVGWPGPSGAPHHEIALKFDKRGLEVEIAAQLLGFAGQLSTFRGRDALVLAGLLSTLLHLALLKWLVAYSQAPAANPPLPETEIALVSPSAIEKAEPPTAPAGASPPATAPQIQARLPPPDGRREPRSDAWTQSRVILSSPALAEPRNWKAAESLKRLEPQTRLQQLCDFEAILQINRQYDQYAADFVIAYATEAAVRKGDAVIARGAAFHSGGQWYKLAFECQLSTSQRNVAHLKFKVGDPIPGDQWADLNLPKAPTNPFGGD